MTIIVPQNWYEGDASVVREIVKDYCEQHPSADFDSGSVTYEHDKFEPNRVCLQLSAGDVILGRRLLLCRRWREGVVVWA